MCLKRLSDSMYSLTYSSVKMSDRNKQLTVSQIKQVTKHQTELARQRIAITKLIDRAMDIAMGETEATATQAKVMMGLIDKVIPNITKTEHEETVTHNHQVPEATRQLLESIAARLPKPIEHKVIEGEVIHDPVLAATDFKTLDATIEQNIQ